MIIVGTFISSLEEPTLVWLPLRGVTVSAAAAVVVFLAAVRVLSPLLVIDGDEKNDNELASLDADPDAGTCTGPAGGWKWNRRTFPDKLKM